MRETDFKAIRASIERVGRLSDSIFRLGPFSVGLDGVLTWIPGVGEIYSTAAAAFILVQGARARVPAHVLLGAALLMGGRTVLSGAPLIGPLFADVFTAHKWAARMVAAAIDREQQLGRAESDSARPSWSRWPALAPAARR